MSDTWLPKWITISRSDKNKIAPKSQLEIELCRGNDHQKTTSGLLVKKLYQNQVVNVNPARYVTNPQLCSFSYMIGT